MVHTFCMPSIYHREVKRIALYLFVFLAVLPVVLLCLSCEEDSTRFRISGNFKNMNQVDLFLVNLQEGTNDTLHVLDGRFSYETNLSDTATMIIIFPNFSELPIIAEPGKDIRIDGDASHLKATTIKGSESNDLLTAFRMKTNEMMPPEVVKEAEDCIRQHAESPVATYLLRHYFLTTAEPDYEKAFELGTLIRNAQPMCVAVVQMYSQLESIKAIRTTGKIPDFRALATDGHQVGSDTLLSEVNIVCLWASWNAESRQMLNTLKRLKKDNPNKMSVVAICLDATTEEGRGYIERDSITFPNVCDSLQWESPLVSTLGLAYVPDNVIYDRQGNILARSLGTSKLKEKIEELLTASE